MVKLVNNKATPEFLNRETFKCIKKLKTKKGYDGFVSKPVIFRRNEILIFDHFNILIGNPTGFTIRKAYFGPVSNGIRYLKFGAFV